MKDQHEVHNIVSNDTHKWNSVSIIDFDVKKKEHNRATSHQVPKLAVIINISVSIYN